VRVAVAAVALALAAFAARLWLAAAPTREATSAPLNAAPEAAAGGPPAHGEISPEDREALRELLREAEREAP
jgi:hypothetical protein